MTALIATRPASTSFRFPWRWMAVGLATYFVFLFATIPAARLSSMLQGKGILAAGVSGSIWNGRAAAMQINGIALGPTEWNVSLWRLFIGSLSADIRSKRDDGYLNVTARASLGGTVTLRDLRGSLPVSVLSTLGLPGGSSGWSGTLQLDIKELAFVNRWPTTIRGTINAANLVGPAQQPTALGSYRITFPAPTAPAAAGEIHGSLASMEDAPLDVVGMVKLTPNRNYLIDAQVATRPSAPGSIVKALQYLGPPDAQGKRPFSFAGSL